MIAGSFTPHRGPSIRLRLIGPTGLSEEIVAVIDTGFNGALILPPTLADWLALEREDASEVELADGEPRLVDVYSATVIWEGRSKEVPAFAMGFVPLIGMALLRGHRLTIDAIDGGAVTIGPIP